MSNVSDYMDICETLSSQLHQAKNVITAQERLIKAALAVSAERAEKIAALEVRIETLKAELAEYKELCGTHKGE